MTVFAFVLNLLVRDWDCNKEIHVDVLCLDTVGTETKFKDGPHEFQVIQTKAVWKKARTG